MGYNKIGFHVGIPGNPTGIGNYVQACFAAGKPANIFGTDATTGISDVLATGDPSLSNMAFRVVKEGGEKYAVPNYSVSPEQAAQEYFDLVEPEIPPELKPYRNLIWILLGNELDKNRSDWLGRWGVASAELWNSHGYRVALFGFSSGEPEPEHWKKAGMALFLDAAAKNPEQIAVNLHEYSYDDNDILFEYPWRVGRFQFLFNACDEMGIARPNVLIGEWGWRQDVAPSASKAILDIADVANLYAQFPEVLFAGIWTLQTWHSQIYNTVQSYIAPNTQFSVDYVQGDFSRELIVSPGGGDNGGNEEVTVFGIDVSHWQKQMDWVKARATGVNWAYIKLSQGTSHIDTFFGTNWEGAKANGIYRGAFHYYEPWTDPVAQAKHFADSLPPDWELKPALDVEDTHNASATENQDIHKFLVEFERLTGIKPVIYTSPGYWNAVVGSTTWAKDYDLWVAHWEVAKPQIPAGWSEYKFWQYAVIHDAWDYGSGSERMDVDVFNGTMDEFLQYIRIPDGTKCIEIPPFTSKILLHPQLPNETQQAWINSATTVGVKMDGVVQVIGFAGWSVYNAFQDIQIAIDAGKTDSRLLVLDNYNDELTPAWMQVNCPKLLPYTRWYTTDGAPPPPPPPPSDKINVLSFQKADPTAWRVVKYVDPNGNEQNEDIQDMDLGGGLWVRRKNDNGEWWKIKAADGPIFAELVHDTSPAPGEEGVGRVYTLYKAGVAGAPEGPAGAPKNPQHLAVGEVWVEGASHLVQFRATDGCGYLGENSGNAQNTAKLVAYEKNYTFNTYDQNLTLDEVIWIQTGVETQVYAKHAGKVVGWVGWEAPWGKSEIVELYFDRGVMTDEPDRRCPFA